MQLEASPSPCGLMRRLGPKVAHRCDCTLLRTERDCVPHSGISRSSFDCRDGRGSYGVVDRWDSCGSSGGHGLALCDAAWPGYGIPTANLSKVRNVASTNDRNDPLSSLLLIRAPCAGRSTLREPHLQVLLAAIGFGKNSQFIHHKPMKTAGHATLNCACALASTAA